MTSAIRIRENEEKSKEKNFGACFSLRWVKTKHVCVFTFKKSTGTRSANSGASNPKTAPKDQNKNQENLKDPFATENTNFNDSNLTPKANKKVSPDQNQQ